LSYSAFNVCPCFAVSSSFCGLAPDARAFDHARGELVAELRGQLEVDDLEGQDGRDARDERDQQADGETAAERDPAGPGLVAIRAHPEEHDQRREHDRRVADDVRLLEPDGIEQRNRGQHHRRGQRGGHQPEGQHRLPHGISALHP